MAQVLANLNAYMQPGGSLDQNLNKAQSSKDYGHTEIFPSPEAAHREEEVDTTIIHELDNQPGDMVILEHSQDEHIEPLDTEGIDKLVPTKDAPQKK